MHNLDHKHGMRLLSMLQNRPSLKSISGTREVVSLFGFKYKGLRGRFKPHELQLSEQSFTLGSLF